VYNYNTCTEKIQYIEELFNEMYDVIRKHNMDKVNHSTYLREPKPEQVSNSYYARVPEHTHNSDSMNKGLKLEIYEKFTKFDQGLFNCLGFIEQEKITINKLDKKHKEVDSRVKQMEADMKYFQEHLQILFNKAEPKHLRKPSGSRKSDFKEVESLVKKEVSKNIEAKLKGFENQLNEIEKRAMSKHNPYRAHDKDNSKRSHAKEISDNDSDSNRD
jgi:hypothetical protein